MATLPPGTIVDLSEHAAEVLRFLPPDGNPKWWTPVVPRVALSFPGNVKDSQVELAHAWSLPGAMASVGEVAPLGRGAVERAIRAYVDG